MPPFLRQDSSSHNKQISQLETRSASPLSDTDRQASSMAHVILEPRSSSDIISPALAPLEPLSTFEEAGPEIRLPSILSKRDFSGLDTSAHDLARRALRTNVIPLSYNTSGAKPGVVVGATLGAVIGFIFLSWLIWLLTASKGTGMIEGSDITDVHVTRRTYSEPRSRRTRRTRTHRSEMSERSSPPRRRERILVEERRRAERSRPPPPPPPREEPPSPEIEREREHIEVEERDTERRVEGDDVVEVFEEQSDMTPEPPRGKKSGYRTVDPDEYAGGNYEQRDMYENDRRRRRHH